MSLSDQKSINPAKISVQVKSGAFVYYDRDEGKDISIPDPFEFIVLDQLSGVKGWSDEDSSGFWSNEVKSISKDELTVRTSKGVKATGIWKEIKALPALAGARYATVLYVAHQADGGLDIARIYLTGAALNAWIEFSRGNRIHTGKVIVSKWEDKKKGAISYKSPVFELVDMSDEESKQATSLDKILQSFLLESTSKAVDLPPAPKQESSLDLSEIPF